VEAVVAVVDPVVVDPVAAVVPGACDLPKMADTMLPKMLMVASSLPHVYRTPENGLDPAVYNDILQS
jgi:hypothetical protein